MMKKLFVFIALVLIFIFFNSCRKEEQGFDEKLLWGKWNCVQGCYNNASDEYWRYYSNYKGDTWVESEDIREEEAQKFTWELVKSELRQVHIVEMGADIPRDFIVTELTSSRLVYRNNLGRSSTFVKVE